MNDDYPHLSAEQIERRDFGGIVSTTDSFHDCAEAEQFILQLERDRDRAELKAERLEEAPTYGDGFAEALDHAARLAELYDTGKQATGPRCLCCAPPAGWHHS